MAYGQLKQSNIFCFIVKVFSQFLCGDNSLLVEENFLSSKRIYMSFVMVKVKDGGTVVHSSLKLIYFH